MSETLIGVIIGGLIGILTSLITLGFNMFKWRKENKISHLDRKKENLERIFNETRALLAESMKESTYSSDMITNFHFLLPTNVNEAFLAYFYDENKDFENLKMHYAKIQTEMKKCLKEIDDEIDKLIL